MTTVDPSEYTSGPSEYSKGSMEYLAIIQNHVMSWLSYLSFFFFFLNIYPGIR